MASRRQTASLRAEIAKSGVPAKLPKELRAIIKVRESLTDPLKDFVRSIRGGRKAIYGVLLHCVDDDDARKIIDAWDLLITREMVSVESSSIHEVLDHAEVSPREFVGIVSRCFFDHGVEAAKAIYHANLPRMMEASMARAMENDATDERAMHFKAMGHLPTSKGIQIAMQQNNNRDHEPEPGEAPPVGRTARRIVRDLPPMA